MHHVSWQWGVVNKNWQTQVWRCPPLGRNCQNLFHSSARKRSPISPRWGGNRRHPGKPSTSSSATDSGQVLRFAGKLEFVSTNVYSRPSMSWTAENSMSSRGCSISANFTSDSRGFTRQPENSKRAHFRAPALQTPPKFTTPRKRKKNENCGGGGEKSGKFRALHPSGPPSFGAPPFGAPLFLGLALWGPTLRGPHTLSSQNSTSKNWPKSKLAEVDRARRAAIVSPAPRGGGQCRRRGAGTGKTPQEEAMGCIWESLFWGAKMFFLFAKNVLDIFGGQRGLTIVLFRWKMKHVKVERWSHVRYRSSLRTSCKVGSFPEAPGDTANAFAAARAKSANHLLRHAASTALHHHWRTLGLVFCQRSQETRCLGRPPSSNLFRGRRAWPALLPLLVQGTYAAPFEFSRL